jgi:signal transduction histidine kinase
MKPSLEAARPKITTSIRTWLQRLIDNSGVTGGAFILAFAFVGLFAFQFVPMFNALPKPELNLAGEWEVCVAASSDTSGCAWNPIHIPSDIPRSLLTNFTGWAIYRTHFTAPATCTQAGSACAFFFQEIGDSAEARLNGHTIGRHGQFPPNAAYAKHYPVNFQVSRDSLKPGDQANELLIVAYSLKKTQAGVRAPPVGLYTVENAFRLSQVFTVINVVNPVLSFVALFMIALLSLAVAGPDLAKDPKFSAFIRYGFVSSCFLLSISEVPREYLPIGFAGYLHFSLRILHDWSFFEMVASYFDYNTKFVRAVRPLYALTLAAFFIQFLVFFVADGNGAHFGRGFDVGFSTLRIVVPLLFLPHLMGLYSGLRRRFTWDGKICISLFAVTLIFQIHDSVIFHGYGSGIYYVKWYPFVIGLIFGVFFLERARDARMKARVEQEQTKQMELIHHAVVGVAHDLEEPLKGLEMACKELQRNPDNKALVKSIADVFPTKVQRIYDLNKAIQKYAKELSTTLELDKKDTNLFDFATSVADEFRELPLLRNIELVVLSDDRSISSLIDPIHMRRVLRNVIRNAAEACKGIPAASVKVEIIGGTMLNPFSQILVTDNGPGVSEKIKARLFEPFESFGKENGTGLGLAMSRRLANAHGGDILLRNSEVGAVFQILIRHL